MHNMLQFLIKHLKDYICLHRPFLKTIHNNNNNNNNVGCLWGIGWKLEVKGRVFTEYLLNFVF